MRNLAFAVAAAGLLSGCLRASSGPTAFPSAPPAGGAATSLPAGPTPTALRAPLPALPTPADRLPSPTPDPYAGLTIDDLTRRTYGEGRIDFEAEQQVSPRFSRFLFKYPSDGLAVHGFLNLPAGQGPFPIVMVLHGYVDPEEYETLGYTTAYADSLAAEGFVVLHPNYRNYPPSDPGPNLFRVGYAVDVLNLIALVQRQAGEAGPLAAADPTDIGLFGHSMGGGIALRILTVESPVEAAVLYGSMNADERLNFEKIVEWSDGTRGIEELNVPPADLVRISPSNYLDRVQAPISIHHGGADELVPPEWSDELCVRLSALGKSVECYRYPAEPHTFIGYGSIELMDRAVAFFRLKFDDP